MDPLTVQILEEIRPIEPLDDLRRYAQCLFCLYKSDSEEVIHHLETNHKFDFKRIMTLNDTYQRIMQINYCRRKVDVLQCPLCDNMFSTTCMAEEHFK